MTAINSTPKLTTLPTEVLQAIGCQVRKRRDLLSLSLVSKRVYGVFRERLWRLITIEFREDGLNCFPPFPCFTPGDRSLDYTREVHFSSEFVRKIAERCPHYAHHHEVDDDNGEDDNDSGEDEVDHEDVENEQEVHSDHGEANVGHGENVEKTPYELFEPLEEGAVSLLNQLQNDTLRSLSWNTGTCPPVEIFGDGYGIIQKQSRIESLSMITDPNCDEVDLYPEAGGLYIPTDLKRLSWRGPAPLFITSLSEMIAKNAETLQHLEVDLLSWDRVSQDMRAEHDDGPHGLVHSIGFWQAPEGKISGPTYPALQTLCLAEIPLTADAVTLFDFNVLRTLKLRNCEKWDILLDKAVQLSLPIGLKTLELRVKPGNLDSNSDEVLSKFLAAFNGLEELYVCLQGPIPTNLLWAGVINHRATLKRFVHHLRHLIPDEHHPNLQLELDEADIGLIVGDAFLQSLDRFPLEAIGFSVGAEDIMRLLIPSARSRSLELLHLRQSASDLDTHGSKGSEFYEWIRLDDDSSGDFYYVSYPLRPQLIRLAEWAFGPDGIPSLKFIACGDYAYGGRPSDSYEDRADVILCRPEGGSQESFRILSRFDDQLREEREEIIEAYRDFLEACPADPLLWW